MKVLAVLKGAFLFALLGLLLGGSYLGFDAFKQQLSFSAFEKQSLQTALELEEELQIVLEITQSVANFYKASEQVTYEEFKTFVNPISANHPSVQAFEWVPVISQDDKQAFIQEAQMSFPGFRLYEKEKETRISVSEREAYYPIYYVYPLEGNESSVGFDLGSEINRLESLEDARDTGKPTSSKKIHLWQSDHKEAPREGFLMFVPVYDGGHETIYERRKNIKGFVIAVFNLQGLLAESNLSNQSDMQIDFNEPLERFEIQPDAFYYSKVLSFGNRDWRIDISLPKKLITTYRWLPLLGNTIVALACLFFIFILYSHRSRDKQAAKIIKEKTDELTYFNDMLSSIQTVQQYFISGDKPERYFDKMLQDLLKFTDSEFGFIGEILYKEGRPYLRTVAITNIAWNYETRKFYRENAPNGLEFYNLDTLFGATIKTGKVVISNDPENDERAGGLPPGHPKLSSYMGIPFYAHNECVGMAGVGNRAIGYSEELLTKIQAFILNCGYIIQEYKLRVEHQKIEAQNYTMARNDLLTGIPNRALFEEQAVKLINLAQRQGHLLALMFIDLDDFKPVNDQYGHVVGDALLRHVATSLKALTRDSDFIARIGGDEFAAVLPSIKHLQEPQMVAQKFLEVVQTPFMIGEHAITIGFSIGIAIYPNHGKTLEKLLSQADRAMYMAKKKGKNNICSLVELDKNVQPFEPKKGSG